MYSEWNIENDSGQGSTRALLLGPTECNINLHLFEVWADQYLLYRYWNSQYDVLYNTLHTIREIYFKVESSIKNKARNTYNDLTCTNNLQPSNSDKKWY